MGGGSSTLARNGADLKMIGRLLNASSALDGVPLIGAHLAAVRESRDAALSAADLSPDFRDLVSKARSGPEYERPFEEPNPLVSICVATFNRSRLLVDRCLRSLVEQTYENIEILVVGDCCTDETEQAVAGLHDRRIRFVNLPERGRYPDDPRLRWMVAGTVPMNHALGMARGAFVTHLDDDDEHSPDRVATLLEFSRTNRADLVFHPFEWERRPGQWKTNPAKRFSYAQVTTSSIFYHRWLRQIPWDIRAHKYLEPGDWNRLRKIKFLRAKLVRYPRPLLKHYVERAQART